MLTQIVVWVYLNLLLVSASFGTTIGQNGCAGLYPAMLAVMVAPTVGINPLDPLWILTLLCVVTLSSIGVAGVGGGGNICGSNCFTYYGFACDFVGFAHFN